MLGQDLAEELQRTGDLVHAFGHRQLDITDSVSVTNRITEVGPDVVVNCAAWTAVDDAESHADGAMAVNGLGTANLASACAVVGARMVQLSTDYVFGGTSHEPYAEGDVTEPRTVYGRTKLAGEQAVLGTLPDSGYVVRTAWLYGSHGRNFARTMIELEGRQDTVSVVNDQHGQPTWTSDVARQIIRLVDAGAEPGVYHATSSGATTWYGFAREIFLLRGADPDRVRPITTAELRRPAPRPAYSVLGHGKWRVACLPVLPAWQESLARAIPLLAASSTGTVTQSQGPRS
jgi:dTDP-4-dehydrorhamnose reductase